MRKINPVQKSEPRKKSLHKNFIFLVDKLNMNNFKFLHT